MMRQVGSAAPAELLETVMRMLSFVLPLALCASFADLAPAW